MAGGGSFDLHEDSAKLKPETIDQHRAIVSVMEELEAVDWYGQRVDAAGNPELRAILAHNRDEEIEHAAMVIEWLRRNNARFDQELKTYLWTSGPIVGVEEGATDGGADAAATSPEPSGGSDGSLGIGSLKKEII